MFGGPAGRTCGPGPVGGLAASGEAARRGRGGDPPGGTDHLLPPDRSGGRAGHRHALRHLSRRGARLSAGLAGEALPGDIGRHRQDETGEQAPRQKLALREQARQPQARGAAGRAAQDEQPRHGPDHEAGNGVVGRGGGAEQGHRQQGGGRRIGQRHARGRHQARHDQEAAADAEEAGGETGAEPDRRQPQGQARADVDLRGAGVARPPHHREGERRHGQGEEDQQGLTVHPLGEARSGQGAGEARGGEHAGAGPLHAPAAGMAGEVEGGVDGDRRRRSADGQMGVAEADDIEQRGGGQHRAAAAEHRQEEADDHAAQDRQDGDAGVDDHGSALPPVRRAMTSDRVCRSRSTSKSAIR